MICPTAKAKYFCKEGWTAISQNCPSGKSPREPTLRRASNIAELTPRSRSRCVNDGRREKNHGQCHYKRHRRRVWRPLIRQPIFHLIRLDATGGYGPFDRPSGNPKPFSDELSRQVFRVQLVAAVHDYAAVVQLPWRRQWHSLAVEARSVQKCNGRVSILERQPRKLAAINDGGTTFQTVPYQPSPTNISLPNQVARHGCACDPLLAGINTSGSNNPRSCRHRPDRLAPRKP